MEFRGPSATAGYFRNETKTRELFHGSWLDSGDRGYMAGGEVYITGRIKDIIIRAGRHIYPQEIEEAIAELPGIRKGCVAVFGVADRTSGTERVVILARDTRERSCGPRSAAGARSTDSYGHRRYAARRSHPRAAADRAEDIERQDTPERGQRRFMKQGGLGRGSECHGFSCCACRLPRPPAICAAGWRLPRDPLRNLVVDRHAVEFGGRMARRDGAAPGRLAMARGAKYCPRCARGDRDAGRRQGPRPAAVD